MPDMKRDSKDPMPVTPPTRQGGDGNVPVTGEDHAGKKAERVAEGDRYDLRTGGETQPTRQDGDGNVPAKGEAHDQKKAERVPEDARF
jgi:hypothetical protein